MTRLTLAAAILAVPVLAAPLAGQEKPLGKNEVRVQVPGCAYNRTFITEEAPASEGVGAVKPGRRLKLNASKELLADIKKQSPSMLELTGRIRTADLDDIRGVPLGGGVRIGGGRPQAGVGTGPTSLSGYNEVMIDVESFRLVPATCPKR
jgi:hypothetical protein